MQHDYNLANQSGADFRADLNNALAAIATVNSGATEPSTTFAHQLWVDTANSLLKIRNAANTDWITFGVSISSSNVFTGNLTGDVTGNLTGNVTGNVTGDLTGNADTATTLATARTISLSGDVAGSASFDGSGDITITTTAQIDSIALGTDTTGDYVQSISGGTGVTITGGTGESSTPVVAIGQAVAITSDVTFNTVTATDEFIGDLEGGVRFSAKADGALSKGDVVYISGVSGDVPTVAKAKADDASKMPAFGLALSDANDNAALQVVTFGTIENLDTSNVSVGQILYVSTTAGEYTTTAPTGESSQIQNIGKVQRSHAAAGSIKVGGAGRSNATPNLNNGKIFIGNGSNQSVTSTLDTSIVPENTNLYWTTARGESMFDTRLATKSTSDVQEGSNLYYTTTRVNSDFDTRLATKDTGDLAEGLNLYYTTTRVNSDFDTRLATKSTSDVQEGVNLYYTDARFDSRLATKDTDDLTEGTNLYYTQARFDSAFANKTTSSLTEGTNLYYTDARANSAIDTRVTKTFVDALNIQAASVDANSVTLGTDTVGNYIQTITGTANKITVTGSGSESADVTITLPDDVQIADSLTVAGNLTVNGTLTSLDTTNLDIEDNLFQLNAGLTGSPVNDSGMLINRGDQDNGIFMWDESVDKFTLGLTTADGTATGNITLNSLGTLVANIEGNVTGNVTGQVSDISNHLTSDLTEGSNLYFTDARADARVNLQTGANLDLSSKSTSDLSEGTNEYFTTARARSSISASGDLSYNSSTGVISFTASAAPVTSVNTQTGAVVLDSDDISEGSTNLYYTDARVQAVSINNVVEDTTPQLGGDLASNGNDILFGDNDKAVFGAGSDLEIYHTGSDSFITDIGTGNLILKGGGQILLQSPADENMIVATGNGAVSLWYDNALKLATTNTGIDVTGTATMDGLTVSSGTPSPSIEIYDTDATYGFVLSQFNSGDGILKTNNLERIRISNGGDISFYEDTGTSQALFWDASAERLGIGTTSPSEELTIRASVPKIQIEDSDGTNQYGQFYHSAGTTAILARNNTTDGTIVFQKYDGTTTDETMRIDSSGNLLVGTTSVNPGLGNTNEGHSLNASGAAIHSADGNNALRVNRNTSDGTVITIAKDGSTVGNIGTYLGYPYIGKGDTTLLFNPDGDRIVPRGTNGGSRDAAIDLGGTSDRFKDLYLSGVASIGNLKIGTDQGTDGQVLTSTGSGIAWEDAAGGGVDGIVSSANATAITIDSSENVGIGTTSPDVTLHVANAGDAYFKVQNTSASKNFQIITGGSGARVRSDDALIFDTGSSPAERMRIHSNGRVGIGTTIDSEAKVDIRDATTGTWITRMENTSAGDGMLLITAATLGSNPSSHILDVRSGGTGYGTNQAFLVEANNTCYINTNSIWGSSGAHALAIQFSGNKGTGIGFKQYSSSATVYPLQFYNSGAGSAGSISYIYSSTSFNTTSDYRLKEQVQDMPSAINIVKALKPKTFEWKADPNDTLQYGFLAHEVQDIFPNAVVGTKDAMHPAVLYEADDKEVKSGDKNEGDVKEAAKINPQQIDHSKLVPILVKTIQELEERITALENS